MSGGNLSSNNATTSPDQLASFSLAEGLERADRGEDLEFGLAHARVHEALFGARATEHRIDRFVLLESVGRGGMGEVFAAYDPQLDRKVALKLVKASARAPKDRDRQLAEARAMAKVSHPNVVQVFEVGLHQPESGEASVFIAMEFVQGQNLRAWVRKSSPPWSRVVKAYREVGRGLMAIHAAGLVHRDVKPDNAMIDDDGRVRVMDFGLAQDLVRASGARPTASELGESFEERTRSGTMAGTPAYMAPEQLEGEPLDHRTDQFALCVSLYEALWGQRPWQATSVAALITAVLEGPGPAVPPRGPVPARIRKAILRGLSRRPEDRWPSMPALLQALGSPRRTWGGVGLAMGTMAVGGGLLWATKDAPAPAPIPPCLSAGQEIDAVWNAEARTRLAEHLGSQARVDAAETSARVSEQLDRYADQWREQGRDACEATHVRQAQSEAMLDLRTMCLDARLAQVRSLVDTLSSTTDAAVITEATAAAYALPSVAVCGDLEALSAPVPPPDDPADRARLVELRQRLAEATAIHDLGEHPRAASLAAALVEDARTLGYPPLLAEVLLLQSNALDEGGDPRAAEAALEQAALAAAEGADDLLAARVWAQLVHVRGHSLGLARETLALRIPLEAALHRVDAPPDLRVKARLNLGQVYRVLKQLDEADALLDEAASIHEREQPDDQLGAAALLIARCQVALDRRERDEAISYAERAVALLQATLGEHHPKVANARTNLGNALRGAGRFDDAERELRRALAIYEGTIGRDNRLWGLALNNLGSVQRMQMRSEDAQASTTEALRLLERSGSQADVAMMLTNQVTNDLQVEKFEDALVHAERARALWVELYGEQDYRVASVDHNIALALDFLGRTEEAVVRWQRALAVLDSVFGPAHPMRYRVVLPLSDAMRRLQRNQDALWMVRASYQTQLTDPRITEAELADTKYFLAVAMWEAGEDREQAVALAEEAYATLAASQGTYRTESEFVRRWLDEHRDAKADR